MFDVTLLPVQDGIRRKEIMNFDELLEIAHLHVIALEPLLVELGNEEDINIRISEGDILDFPETRNVAYTMQISPRQYEIVFAPKWETLTSQNYEAVLRHELGHVAHMAIPDIRKQLAKRSIYLSTYDELFADEFAEFAFGDNLYYDEDLIQTIDVSVYPRRPYWLNL